MIGFNDFTVANLSTNASEFPTAKGGGEQMHHVYNAKVLDFSGGKAVLEINGRVVTAESEVPLKRNAEFALTIKGYQANGKVQLQVMGARETSTQTVRPLTDAMINSRLMGFDLPEHPRQIAMARSLLALGAAVTRSNMAVMIETVPTNASQQTIDFAASMVKEQLPLSRELLGLIPQMKQELDALPQNLRQAAETAARAGVPPPDIADVKDIIQKLPSFVNAFTHSTEARLEAVITLGIAESEGGQQRASFMDQLLSLLKMIPDSPPAQQSQAAALETEIRALLQQMENTQLKSAELDRQRADFLQAARQALQNSDTAAKFQNLRSAVLLALRNIMGAQSQADAARASAPAQPAAQPPPPPTTVLPPPQEQAVLTPKQSAAPPLSEPALTALPKNISAAADSFNNLQQLLGGNAANQNPAALREEIIALLSRLAAMNNFEFNQAGSQPMKDFSEAANQWARTALEFLTQGEQGLQKLAADADSNALLDRIRTIFENAQFRQDLNAMAKNFSETQDLRAALARMLAGGTGGDQAAEAARNLARGLQFANFANVVQHTPTAPLESMVTFFPYKIGGKLHIGKLNVYRREDDDQQKNKGAKPLDPYDARLAIILDTDFLGLSMISFQTYRNKGIELSIEVQDVRRREFVAKYIGELREALKKTSYEQNTVNVKVRRRKSEMEPSPAPQARPSSKNVASVDLRI